ncbi:MAG: peptide chain release factor N(5)-glutamine methyltransferase [Lachnospiraceae bacterium]|nr:peptide chain release factor N(5)-glutamine methyltransferase [Lachnospiraceae bacterium]
MKYREVYKWGTERLKEAGISEAELDARILLESTCQTDRNTLLVHGDREVSSEEYDSYVNYISQREKHIPLQYITGVQEFMGLEFEVNENVLIPRQDTEILVEEVMRYLHDGMRVLDMCTGSGCILLSLLYYSNDCMGLGVDVSQGALDVAARNLDKLKALKGEIDAKFMQGDLFEGLEDSHYVDKASEAVGSERNGLNEDREARFDIIVSNPPYIKSSVIETLMPEVREHEPASALDGREDGLYFYRRIIEQAGVYLFGGGRLFFEIGFDQGEAVKSMMEAAGYKQVEIVKDYAGLDRVVHGKCEKYF